MRPPAPDRHPPLLDEERYSRQILFPGIGREGQALLADAQVAIVGVGATGAAAASLLARAGVGQLTLIDRDFVEPSNLQRQILFDEADALLELPKTEAARAKIRLFNSTVEVKAVVADLVPENIHSLLAGADLLLDCTDNFETRYLLNDFAVQQGVPWIYAGAVGAYAATMNILPSTMLPPTEPTACLACLFPTPPSGLGDTCDTSGILATAVNLAASLQVTEALKLLTKQHARLRRTLLGFDLWSGERSEISNSRPDPSCMVCAGHRFRYLEGAARPQITLCGRNSVQIHEHRNAIDLNLLEQRLASHPDVEELRANALLLRFKRGAYRVTVFSDGRALIQGTTDPAVARSLYARFLGA